MDNLTHTLVGVTLGKTREFQNKTQEKFFIFSSVIANNIPDIDPVYTWISGDKTLGYLLHHRGHTHTLLFAPLMAILALFISSFISKWPLWKYRKHPLTINSFMFSLLGVCIHIFLDYTNIYGVHPFWPFENSWYYGDFIFIIEPFIWFLLLPYVYFNSKTRNVKRIWSVVTFFAVIAVFMFSGFSFTNKVSIYLWFSIFSFLYVWKSDYWRAKKVLGLLLGIIVLLFATQKVAYKKVQKELTFQQNKSDKSLQLMVGPYPANPFCWSFIHSYEKDNHIYIDRGILKLPYGHCRQLTDSNINSIRKKESNLIAINDTRKFAKRDYLELKEKSCHFVSFLKFARFPFFEIRGESVFFGDLRFDRSDGVDFTEGRYYYVQSCPSFIPNWNPPFVFF